MGCFWGVKMTVFEGVPEKGCFWGVKKGLRTFVRISVLSRIYEDFTCILGVGHFGGVQK